MKKLLIALGILIVVGVAVFLYITRPVATPETDIATRSTENQLSGTPYRISQSDSSVSFHIKEILRDKPFTAVGTTNQVAGDITIDEAAQTITMGTITVDARTLKTDSTNRDGAINRAILKTGTAGNETITFVPKPVTMTEKITLGTPFTFSVNGDLTISGITKPATFAVTATQSAAGVKATIATTLKRSDYNLTIPSIPFVANVDDTFEIKGTVVAKKI